MNRPVVHGCIQFPGKRVVGVTMVHALEELGSFILSSRNTGLHNTAKQINVEMTRSSSDRIFSPEIGSF
jgi:hypothetical protein